MHPLHKKMHSMKAVWQDLCIGESGAKWHTYLTVSTNMTTWKVSHKCREEVLISALVFKTRKHSICLVWNFYIIVESSNLDKSPTWSPPDDAIFKWISCIKTLQIHPCNTKQRTSKEKKEWGSRQAKEQANPVSHSFEQSPLAVPHVLFSTGHPTAAIRPNWIMVALGVKGACTEPQTNSKTLLNLKMKLLDSGKQLLPLVLNPSYTRLFLRVTSLLFIKLYSQCVQEIWWDFRNDLTPCPKAQTKGWQNRRKRHRHLFKA